ncbi:MAG: hypothetical protein ACK4K7_03280 [Allosphingosinicella sp.]|uniref:hypothetical protein n=1 Tax=Allosphingosinicella sp. TaxID=2823234 RepID=UPI0039417B27
MSDIRSETTTGAGAGPNPADPNNPYEGLDDEYHSSLELDDSSGWRAFIVPGILVLFLIGALALTFMGGSGQPDPRIADRLNGGAQTQAVDPAPAGATGSAITPPDQVPQNVEAPDGVQPAQGGVAEGRTASQ